MKTCREGNIIPLVYMPIILRQMNIPLSVIQEGQCPVGSQCSFFTGPVVSFTGPVVRCCCQLHWTCGKQTSRLKLRYKFFECPMILKLMCMCAKLKSVMEWVTMKGEMVGKCIPANLKAVKPWTLCQNS